MGNLVVAGRVAVSVAVVPLFAVGPHGRVAKVLEKATVLVSDDGLAWIRRTTCSLAAYAADLDLLVMIGAVSLLWSACCSVGSGAGLRWKEAAWPGSGSAVRGKGGSGCCCCSVDCLLVCCLDLQDKKGRSAAVGEAAVVQICCWGLLVLTSPGCRSAARGDAHGLVEIRPSRGCLARPCCHLGAWLDLVEEGAAAGGCADLLGGRSGQGCCACCQGMERGPCCGLVLGCANKRGGARWGALAWRCRVVLSAMDERGGARVCGSMR